MRNKWIKQIFPLIALALLLPWPVAYAADVAGGTNEDEVRIEIAEETLPNFTAWGKAIGSVPAGDLFYIDGQAYSRDHALHAQWSGEFPAVGFC